MIPTGHHEAGLHEWSARLWARPVPAFSGTVLEVARLTASERSCARDLAHIVLRDPAFTARVLRAANSSVLNPNRHAITTVSRAIVMLGFDALRRISVSIALIDEFLHGPYRERIMEELALSFHAGCFARALAAESRDPDPEEMFIAALLCRLGEIGFWSSADERALALYRLERTPGYTRARAEREVLGFPLGALTAQLNREWKASPLLDIMLSGSAAQHPRARCIYHAHRVASGVKGNAPALELDAMLEDVAQAFSVPPSRVGALVRGAAREAARFGEACEIPDLAREIPQIPDTPGT
jgi:hypothetical protein